MAYTLGRSTAGTKLLARCEHDNVSFPFATASWDLAASLSVALDTARLKFTSTTDSVQRWARLNTIASRGKAYIYVEYEAPDPVVLGVLAHVTDITVGSMDGLQHYFNIDSLAAASSYSGIMQFVNQAWTGTVLDDTFPLSGAKTNGAAHTTSMFVDGTAVRARDYVAAETYVATAALSAGQIGIAVLGTAVGVTGMLRRLIIGPDRYALVTGLPTGATVEAQTSAAAVLKTASESSGTATLDMEFTGLPTAVRLVVKASGGAVLRTLDAAATGEIIEPGETYALTSSTDPLIPYFIGARNRTDYNGTSWAMDLTGLDLAADDVLLLFNGTNRAGATATITAGWTELGNQSGTAVRGFVWWKRAVGNETSVTATHNVSSLGSARIEVWRNALVDPTLAGVGSLSGTNTNPPSHTAGRRGSNIFLALRMGSIGTATVAPSGYGGFVHVNADNGERGSVSSSYRNALVQTEDPGTFTSPSDASVAYTLALVGPALPSTGGGAIGHRRLRHRR